MRRRLVEREVAEHRRVVHPAGERAGGTRGVRGALCHRGVARVAADHRRPRMLVRVEVEDDDVAVLRRRSTMARPMPCPPPVTT